MARPRKASAARRPRRPRPSPPGPAARSRVRPGPSGDACAGAGLLHRIDRRLARSRRSASDSAGAARSRRGPGGPRQVAAVLRDPSLRARQSPALLVQAHGQRGQSRLFCAQASISRGRRGVTARGPRARPALFDVAGGPRLGAAAALFGQGPLGAVAIDDQLGLLGDALGFPGQAVGELVGASDRGLVRRRPWRRPRRACRSCQSASRRLGVGQVVLGGDLAFEPAVRSRPRDRGPGRRARRSARAGSRLASGLVELGLEAFDRLDGGDGQERQVVDARRPRGPAWRGRPRPGAPPS